jgi:hypothetical protein
MHDMIVEIALRVARGSPRVPVGARGRREAEVPLIDVAREA